MTAAKLKELAAAIATLPPGTLGTESQPVPPYQIDRIPGVLAGLWATIAKVEAAESRASAIIEPEA